jgi:hypothetical protein
MLNIIGIGIPFRGSSVMGQPLSSVSVSVVYNETLSEATLTAVATGGKGTKTYVLYLDDVQESSNTTGIFALTESGTYTVVVTDEGGASEVSGDVEVVRYFGFCWMS